MSTQNIPFFIYKKEKHHKLSQICNYGIFSKGLKNEFETAVVNEPSVFEPLKLYCSRLCTMFDNFIKGHPTHYMYISSYMYWS